MDSELNELIRDVMISNGGGAGFGAGGGVTICCRLRLIFLSFPWGGKSLISFQFIVKSSKISKCNNKESNNPFSVLMVLSLYIALSAVSV